MTLRPMVLGLFLLVACGDSSGDGGGSPGGGTAQAGSSAGGAGEGGAGGETATAGASEGGSGEGGSGEGGSGQGGGAATLQLEIAGDELSTVVCATYDGHWSTAETSFDANGQVTNLECALVAAVVDGEPYWITSQDFDGTVGASDLRHSFSTAEALIAVGSQPLELDGGVFSGVLEVVTLASDSVEIRIE